MTARNGLPCKKCGTSEWYSDGRCKRCRRDQTSRYRQEKPERVRNSKKNYYEKNKEAIGEKGRQWRRDNLDRLKERDRQYRKSNPEKRRANNRRWAEANREKTRAAVTNWYNRNKERVLESNRRRYKEDYRNFPEKIIAKSQRRRTRKSQGGGSYTAAEWRELCQQYNNKCLCCGRSDVRLTPDHVLPVSKGGSSDISNIQPLCLDCNLKKGVKTTDYRRNKISRWIQRKLFG